MFLSTLTSVRSILTPSLFSIAARWFTRVVSVTGTETTSMASGVAATTEIGLIGGKGKLEGPGVAFVPSTRVGGRGFSNLVLPLPGVWAGGVRLSVDIFCFLTVFLA